jgi:hypothetical protein
MEMTELGTIRDAEDMLHDMALVDATNAGRITLAKIGSILRRSSMFNHTALSIARSRSNYIDGNWGKQG